MSRLWHTLGFGRNKLSLDRPWRAAKYLFSYKENSSSEEDFEDGLDFEDPIRDPGHLTRPWTDNQEVYLVKHWKISIQNLQLRQIEELNISHR